MWSCLWIVIYCFLPNIILHNVQNIDWKYDLNIFNIDWCQRLKSVSKTRLDITYRVKYRTTTESNGLKKANAYKIILKKVKVIK